MAQLSDECMKVFKGLNRRKTRWITYKIDEEKLEIVPEKISERDSNYLEFLSTLPDTSCRYAVYDHEFVSKDGRQTGKCYFMFWKPKNSSQTNNVIYTEALSLLRDKVYGCVNHNIADEKDVHDLLGNEHIKGKGFTKEVQDESEEESEEDFD